MLEPAYEHVLAVPLSASVWIIDTMCALLLPSAMGQIPRLLPLIPNQRRTSLTVTLFGLPYLSTEGA